MTPSTFDDWRAKARDFLSQDIPPERTFWGGSSGQDNLFDTPHPTISNLPKSPLTISKDFLSLAKTVSSHRDDMRWMYLYRALWRIRQGEKHLLQLTIDPLVHKLSMMRKAVSRDAHKAKAFVRFRLIHDDIGEHYLAWHQPDHFILPVVAPFFMRRFAVMRWTILTPDQSVHWNGENLQYGAGAPSTAAAPEDCLEDMWRTYYRSTFNPARIKLDMMRREIPVRYWHTMPETQIIDDMLREAPDRVEKMIRTQEGFASSAEFFLPKEKSIPALKEAAFNCQGCPLHRMGTCTVFGEGPEDAPIMVVGEQPGDQEDLQGRPFVGPAGKILDDVLVEAGVKRGGLYLTNAVKHFKHDKHGLLRTHRTPDNREIAACHPWLREEIAAIKPKAIIMMGVTAGRSLIGPGYAQKPVLGKILEGPQNSSLIPTYHPAAYLRMPDTGQKTRIFEEMVSAFKTTARF